MAESNQCFFLFAHSCLLHCAEGGGGGGLNYTHGVGHKGHGVTVRACHVFALPMCLLGRVSANRWNNTAANQFGRQFDRYTSALQINCTLTGTFQDLRGAVSYCVSWKLAPFSGGSLHFMSESTPFWIDFTKISLESTPLSKTGNSRSDIEIKQFQLSFFSLFYL